MKMADKYPQYFREVAPGIEIDLYAVARLWHLNDPALFHAFKKIVAHGDRGTKSSVQDIREARDALTRWLELHVSEKAELV